MTELELLVVDKCDWELTKKSEVAEEEISLFGSSVCLLVEWEEECSVLGFDLWLRLFLPDADDETPDDETRDELLLDAPVREGVEVLLEEVE